LILFRDQYVSKANSLIQRSKLYFGGKDQPFSTGISLGEPKLKPLSATDRSVI